MNYSKINNSKLITILCITTVLFACSEQKTTQEYILASKVYIHNIEYGAAIIELKNAVRQAPKDAEARYYLSKAHIEQGSYVNAEKELEKADQFGFDMALLLPDLVFIKSKLNKVEEVYALVENAAALNDEQYTLVLTYAGITALKNKELEKAQDFIAQANTISEASLYSQMGSAYLYHAQNNFSKGIEIIDSVLEVSPEFTEALLLKGHLLFSSEKFIEANEVYTKYRKRHSLANHVRFFEVNSLILAGEYQAADEKVIELLTLFKDAPLALQYKAQIEYQQKNYNQAKKYADMVIQQGDEFLVAKMIAGISAYQLGDIEQAYSNLIGLEKYIPASHPVKKILVAIKIKLGYNMDAVNTLKELEGLTEADAELFQSSSMLLMKAGDFDTAKALLDKASKVAPKNAYVEAQKGMLKLYQNDKTGIDSLEYALKLDPKLAEIELSLAIQYLDNGAEEKAQLIAQKWIDSQNDKASGYLLLGIIHLNKNRNVKAAANFLKVLEVEPANHTALFNLAIIADDAARSSDAVDYYQQVLRILPGHKGAIQRLSRLQVKQHDISSNVAFLNDLVDKHPDNITLMLGLAQNLRLNNELKKAISLLEKVKDKSHFSQTYWTILGDSYLQEKNTIKAKTSFDKVLDINENNYVAHLRIIGIYEYERQYQLALDYTLKLLEKFTDNTQLLILKANFELLTGKINAAKQTVEYLQVKGINHHLINKYVAELALTEKDYVTAIDNFNELYEKKPTALNVMLLARALKFNGQKDEATQTLETYLARSIKDHQVRMLLAELYMQFNDEKAIKHLEIINQSEKNNVVVLNNLAMLEMRRARPQQALQYAEKAFELKSNIHQISDTYGSILVMVKDFDTAMTVLENAIKQGSKEGSTYVNLAKAYLATGNNGKVKVLLSSIKDKTLYSKIEALL